ncbi:MAG: GNAT family N-acetyltransferase [Flavobacteriales bacterium]|nr:GNAT family N-acetyltransferase [Flavobacteriales bacterium]
MSDLVLPEGKLVALRPVTAADANERYLRWLNDPEVVKHLETVPQPYTMEMLKQYIAGVIGHPGNYFFMLIDKSTGREIGTMRLHNVNRHHGTCNIGIMIGERDLQGKGFGTDAYHTGIRFAFESLGLRKIWEAVNARNTASLAMFARLGFEEEGRWKAHVRTADGFDDKILLSLFSERFLQT